jgi:hypothetical protein
MEEEQGLLNEVADRNELMTTRAALADILWLAVGALFAGGHSTERSARDE